jgi:hypothetical protein
MSICGGSFMMLGSILIGLLALSTLSGGGTSPVTTHRFVTSGVYMNMAIVDDNNKHVVGAWVTEVDLPPDSDTAAVQKAAQEKCATTAPNGWRCAEMEQWDLDKRGWRNKPCAATVLGLYRHYEKGKDWTYALWDGEAGFETGDAATAWAQKALRDMATQNKDTLVRSIQIAVNCKTSAS